jgi:O-acetyl-ADP-ribose deacetylase (regulator of RNase III)
MIKTVKGDATLAESGILVHVVNDVGAWGKGFVLAVSRRWPHVKYEYKKHWQKFELGDVQFVFAKPGLVVANLFGQRGISGKQCVRYGALKRGLRDIAEVARDNNLPVHMPKIGCGLAGGSWIIVRDLIEQELAGLDVTIYEWEGK